MSRAPATLLALCLFAAAPAQAVPFAVNSTADAVDNLLGDGVCLTAGSVCTLRAAIQEANAFPGNDTISLPAGNYILTIAGSDDFSAQGDLDITSNLSISGAGASASVIDANTIDRVLDVRSGTVSISGVTIRGGNLGNKGGGIRNLANLSLTDSTVTNNTATEGGGIHVEGVGTTLVLDTVTLVLNSASKGGGIRMQTDGASATLTDVIFDRNTASLQGGGMAVEQADASLSGVTFMDNDADTGAGLWTKVATSNVDLTNVTFSGNDSTGEAGGIWAEGGTLTLDNVTIAGNTASIKGGGIRPRAGTVTLRNSIVSGNTPDQCERAVTSGGNNIDSGTTCGLPAGESNIDPVLGPLQDNGGPTWTHALLTGSPAVDAGATLTVAADQRGVTRPQGAAWDIGAYEASVSVQGTVFEDVNYGGGSGRNQAASSGVGVAGARVEVYDAAGNYLAATTTDGTGSYGLVSLNAGASYTVRVVNGSVPSSRTGWVAGIVPVQTYRTDASGGSPVGVTDRVGGEVPEKVDAGNGSTTLAALTTGTIAPQSITTVAMGATPIAGVDFGFNFNTIVNTNDTGQGSLGQFLTNSNALGNGGLAIAGQPAGKDVSIFMIPDGLAHPGLRAGLTNQLDASGVAVVTPATILPAIGDADTTLDGTTQTVNVGNTNAVTLGTGGTVGVDGLSLSTVAGPEVQIVGSGSITQGIRIAANDVTLRGLAIHGFDETNTGNGGIHLADATTGALIEENVIGSPADAFADPGSGFRNFENVYSAGADNGTLRNNLVGFGDIRGILLAGGSVGWTIENNEFRDNSLDNPFGDGIALDPGQATVSKNLIVGSASQGVVVAGSTGSTFTNNTIQGNGIGTTAASGAAAGMTFRPTASGHTVYRNKFIANYGAGLSVNNGSTGIKITQNDFSNNGTIAARNMDLKTDQIGIDLNNPTDDANIGTSPYVSLNDPGDTPSGGNDQLNYPVLDTAVINGSNLELTGWARPGSVIEVFLRDPDPSLFGEGQTYRITLTENGTGSGGGSGEDPYPDLDTGPATMYADPVNALNQGTDTTNRFNFSFPTPMSVVTGAHLTATARDGSNNTSEFSGNVTTQVLTADLGITVSDNPDPAPLNGPLVYTLLITNNGSGTATGVSVTDTLPASVTLQSATPSQGSCSGTTTVTCTLGSIVSSGTASVEILVTTTATGTITNNVGVTADQTDPVAANDTDSEDTEVVADSAIVDVPLTQFDRIHGFIDYTVTGGSLRTMPNGGGGAACAVGASSSASIAGIPGTATVSAAYLYWGGSGSTVDNAVTFDGTGVTADRTFVSQFNLGANTYDFFGGFEDVTAQVAAKGNGSYSFQDLTVDTGNPYCSARAVLAGWSLVVVYEDTSLTGKTLVLYDGFDLERNGSTSYLLTGIFAADPPEAKTSFLVWEGDPDLGGGQEKLEFNGTAQFDALNPVNNVYNSTINSLGSSTEWGVDLDTFDVTSEVAADDTLATVEVFTGPDLVILNAVVLQVKSNIIVGKVFEDVNYGGGVGRNRSTAAAAAPSFTVDRPGATVELYDVAGTFLRTTTTNASGQYGFAGLVDGDYQVRVVNETVDSSRPSATGAEWPVQTYRTDASTGTALPVVGEVGGAGPQLQDAGPNVAMANLGSFIAQSVAPAQITTGVAVTGVDFGYNFDAIVNTNDAGQGSLRQFILNSNLLTNANLDQDDAPAGVSAVTKNAGDEHSIFMIPASELVATVDGGGGTVILIQPSSGLDSITDANTALDGRTQTALTGDTNGAVADVTTGPEVIVDHQGTVAADVLTVRGDDTIVDSLGLTGASGAGWGGIDAVSLSGAQFRNNTIFDNGAHGVYLSTVTGSSITDNVIRNNGVDEIAADGVLLIDASPGNTISGNEIVANAAFGVELSAPGASNGNTITGNLIKGNGVSAGDENAGIRVDASDNSSFTLNTITENPGDGMVITSGDFGNLISQNSIFNNGELGIDLSLNSDNGGDGVTPNDDPDLPGGGNNRQNFPEITFAGWNGANTVVKGTLTSTPGATFDIEIFSSGVCNGAVNGSPQADAYGEGATYRVTANVTDGDSDGIVTFSANVPVNLTGQQITATATDTSDNDTSEFSACYAAATRSIVKRAFQVDGTPIASGSTLPTGMPVRFILYVDNSGGAVSDVSMQDVLNPLFIYQAGSMKIDDTLVSSVVCPGGVCNEAAIFSQVNGSGTPLGDGDAVTAPIDADSGSYDSGSKTLHLGDGTNGNNAQLDLASDRVWALVFTITIQ